MSFLRGRVLLSLFLILLGVTLLVNNLNIEGFELDLGTYWPVFPLLWGVGMALESMGREARDGHKAHFSMGQLVTGLVVIFISAAYLGRNLELFLIDFSTFWQLFWPIVIILIGISLFRGRAFTRGSSKANWAVMGEVDKGSMAWDLKNDSYVAVMGAIKLDLSRATIPEGRTELECTAIMGGIDIFVPDGIGVILDGNVVLGGVEFLRESAGGIIANKRMEFGLKENPSRVVIIKATAIMGGITVKRT
jgi:lia operon protein LiaF